MNFTETKRIILASGSPRRKELMAQIGLNFEVIVSNVEEHVTSTDPGLVVEELSAQKAQAVFDSLNNGTSDNTIVIGADTVVSMDGQILGKPRDGEEACEMLRSLRGRSHAVYTGVTLIYEQDGKVARRSFHERTEVTFFPMSEEDIQEYVATGDPLDKAGAYGIQGFCARYIQKIHGDYNNVVGLPIGRLYQELTILGQKRPKPKAIIFDLDGTLSDSINSMKYCGDIIMGNYGYGPFTEDEYKQFVGDGAANLVKRALIAGGDTELTHFETAFEEYKELFAEHCMHGVKPYDGIRELLTELKKQDIKIATLSNKPHAQTIEVIETLFGKDYFDVIMGQQEGTPIKPDPTGVYKIMDIMNVTPYECIYLGDTGTDMQTGKSAGLYTVGALWGFRDAAELLEAHADRLILKPMDLLHTFCAKEHTIEE